MTIHRRYEPCHRCFNQLTLKRSDCVANTLRQQEPLGLASARGPCPSRLDRGQVPRCAPERTLHRSVRALQLPEAVGAPRYSNNEASSFRGGDRRKSGAGPIRKRNFRRAEPLLGNAQDGTPSVPRSAILGVPRKARIEPIDIHPCQSSG